MVTTYSRMSLRGMLCERYQQPKQDWRHNVGKQVAGLFRQSNEIMNETKRSYQNTEVKIDVTVAGVV